MSTSYLELSSQQIWLAAFLLLINGAISVWLKLNLGGSLLVASLRTLVQLWLIGLILGWIFDLDRWYAVLGIIAIMTLIAGVTAVQRTKHRYDGIWGTTILSIWVSSWFVTGYALLFIFRGTEKWYEPQYAIPLTGMLLGNTLNGISIGLNSFLESVSSHRREIETRLSLGATRWEAVRPNAQESVRNGMIPIINAMMVVGLVSLPGMMTGQILAGADPAQAVKYQIVIMFLIASTTALGTVTVVLLSFLKIFNKDHQLVQRILQEK